ncbi:MAG: hypothetical protein NTV73_05830 [Hyphomicrobiales bacterium]|nr:hypothetical protein [Hyphomicrobiales bacterium]
MVEQISANRAKQGRSGKRVLLVLVIGLALAAIAWFGLEFYGESIATQSATQPGATETPATAH